MLRAKAHRPQPALLTGASRVSPDRDWTRMVKFVSAAWLLQITGGNPMNLTGNVVLCSRADADSERHFDGKLAYLGKRPRGY